MCKQCGSCSTEHYRTLDDGIDEVEQNPLI